VPGVDPGQDEDPGDKAKDEDGGNAEQDTLGGPIHFKKASGSGC
jgi:hypothetical protein